MKLYHGTSSKHLPSILKNGLVPRGSNNKRSNWNHTIKSRAGFVYLTSAYAGYFAFCSTKKKEKGVILEIDTDKLDEKLFFPDEDFLGQIVHSQRKDGDLIKQTHEIDIIANQHLWKKSVEMLGNCCYKNVIPITAITRYVEIDNKRSDILWAVADPTISIINFRFCSYKYIELTKWLFGDRENAPSNNAIFPGAEEQILQLLPEELKIQLEKGDKKFNRRDGIYVKEIV